MYHKKPPLEKIGLTQNRVTLEKSGFQSTLPNLIVKSFLSLTYSIGCIFFNLIYFIALNETPTNSDETNPTPGYNFGILSDLRMKENNDLLKRLLTTKQITESIQMVKLWLLKRGLNTVSLNLSMN